ncbi:MAG: SDR family oxidoreductase [Planctomycetota bacterium]
MTTPAESPVFLLGATGGIGVATARLLDRQGFPLTLAGRDAGKLEVLAKELDSPQTVLCDATDAEQVKAAYEGAVAHHGKVGGVANLVGSLVLKPAHATSVEDWRNTITLSLDSAFYLLRACAQGMCKSGGGSVVLMSSAVGKLGFAAHEAVAAAKGGVQGLMLSAAASYASRGLRVNCVSPGTTETPLAEPILRSEPSKKATMAMTPDGKIGTPEAVASAIAWLLHPDQWHVTGQNIGVDGGLSSLRAK